MTKSIPKTVYNSVVKIITTKVEMHLTIPYSIQEQSQSIGAGFFIDKGNILTAAHVIDNAVEIWIRVPSEGQRIYKAEIVSVYPDFDIGIIRAVDYKNRTHLKLGNSDNLKLREGVYALGYPNNPKYPIVTSGTISGYREDYIQTDTPVNVGNSGGPLLNNNNEVVGITSAKVAQSEGSSLIVPVNILKTNITFMLESNEKIIHKNILGLLLVNANDTYKELYGGNIKCKQGIVIKKVIENSPLEGRVEENDMICSFNDGNQTYKLDFYGETDVPWEAGKVPLNNLVKRCIPRQKVTIKLWSVKRQKLYSVKFNLKTFNELYPIRSVFSHIEQYEYEIFGGMIVMNLTLNHLMLPQLQHLLYIIRNEEIYKPQLLISHIFPNSKLAQHGILSNFSLIKKVNNKLVNTVEQFREVVKKPVKKGTNKFIIIETDNLDKVILNMKDVVKQEKELSHSYKYNTTSVLSGFTD